MKIMLSCLGFGGLTGSELYYYELSRALAKRDNKVTVISDFHGSTILSDKAEKDGVVCVQGRHRGGMFRNHDELPDQSEFDVACFSHGPVFRDLLLPTYESLPKLMVCHSEVLDMEDPIKHHSIKHYIGIRPSVCSKITKKGISGDKITLIKNPIDFERFNSSLSREVPERKTVLFVGSVDNLRYKPVYHLWEMSITQGFDLVIVGRNDWPEIINKERLKGAEIHPPCWDVEKYLKEADVVAGIFMGRTTIEGWCSGKTSLQYIVDKGGNIVDLIEESPPDDLSEFDSNVVAEKIENCLKNI